MFQLEETAEITQLLVPGCLSEDSSRPGQAIVLCSWTRCFTVTVPLFIQGYRGNPDRILGGGGGGRKGAGNLQSSDILS